MNSRTCKQDKDRFCYICGFYIPSRNYRKHCLLTSSQLQKAYYGYFGLCLTIDYGKPWSPSFACGSCNTILLAWLSGQDRHLSFKIPRVWRIPTNHVDDCYFCLTHIPTFSSSKSLKKISYPSIPSSIAPVPFEQGDEKPVRSTSEEVGSCNEIASEASTTTEPEENDPKIFDAQSFSDLSRKLKLSKRQALELRGELEERHLVDSSVTYRSVLERSNFLRIYFEITGDLAYCSNINGLLSDLSYPCDSSDWVLFIDGSTRSLKAVLLHISNQKPAVPIAYGKNVSENYENIESLLRLLGYSDFKWNVCCDFKMLQILCGLKYKGNMKYPCIFCLFDSYSISRYTISNWPSRTSFQIGEFGVINRPLIPRENVILPSLHIKSNISQAAVLPSIEFMLSFPCSPSKKFVKEFLSVLRLINFAMMRNLLACLIRHK